MAFRQTHFRLLPVAHGERLRINGRRAGMAEKGCNEIRKM
jgi:hypothetical protein